MTAGRASQLTGMTPALSMLPQSESALVGEVGGVGGEGGGERWRLTKVSKPKRSDWFPRTLTPSPNKDWSSLSAVL